MALDANTTLVNVLVAQRNQALDTLAVTSRDLALAKATIDDLNLQIVNLKTQTTVTEPKSVIVPFG